MDTQKGSTTTLSQKSSATAERALKAFLETQRIRVTADSLRLWVASFADLTLEQLSDALLRFTKEGSEFPTPAAVRKFAGYGEAGIDDRAAVAWASVRREMHRTGAYESVTFDDQMINAAIRNMGGWERLCETPIDQIDWKGKEFIAMYKTIVRTGIGDGSPLHGITARLNAGRFKAPAPRLIATGLSPHPVAARLTAAPDPNRLGVQRNLLTLKGADE